MAKNQTFVEMSQRVNDAAASLNADIIAYFGDVTEGGAIELCDQLEKMSARRKNALLILATYGGDANAAYRIARRIQKIYDTRNKYKEDDAAQFWCFVPTSCKSAGTIVTLGADKLIISRNAELGPIDPQHRKQDEVGERLSGLTPTMALNTLHGNARASFVEHFRKLRSDPKLFFSTKMAAEIASNLTVGLLKPIFEQIDPTRLAEMERSMKLAVDYGQRLDVGNLKAGALAKLLSDYPSHGFIIDGDEAKELFENVEVASSELEVISNDFRSFYSTYLERDEPFVYVLSATMQTKSQGEPNAESGSGVGSTDGNSSGAAAAAGTPTGGEADSSATDSQPQEQDGNVVKLAAGSPGVEG